MNISIQVALIYQRLIGIAILICYLFNRSASRQVECEMDAINENKIIRHAETICTNRMIENLLPPRPHVKIIFVLFVNTHTHMLSTIKFNEVGCRFIYTLFVTLTPSCNNIEFRLTC